MPRITSINPITDKNKDPRFRGTALANRARMSSSDSFARRARAMKTMHHTSPHKPAKDMKAPLQIRMSKIVVLCVFSILKRYPTRGFLARPEPYRLKVREREKA